MFVVVVLSAVCVWLFCWVVWCWPRFDVCSFMICFTFACLVIYDGFGVVWLSGLVCLVVGGWLMFRLWLLNSVVFGMCSCWYIICLICLFGFSIGLICLRFVLWFWRLY